MDGKRHADVIVVGAGFAGLSAADQLEEHDLDVIVLEARDRVGGRTFNHTLPNGITIDLGGQWVGPEQKKINHLLERFGIPTIPTYGGGRDLKVYGGQLLGETPPAVQALFDQLDQMGKQLALDAPETHLRAAEWDSMTFATWLRQESSDHFATNLVARAVAGGLLAGAAGDYSLLHTLFYLASGGGVASMLDCTGGAQDARIVGGSQALAQALADHIGSVRLNQPVRRIVQYRDGVVVTTDDGDYRAGHVVVAIPPALAGRIDYHPALPAARDGLTQRMAAGYALKMHVFYERPFWREVGAGWSGYAITDGGVIAETFDNSPPDNSYFDLVVFVYGTEAAWLRQQCKDCQRKAILDNLAYLYGPQAYEALCYLSYDWAEEPWTRGCFSGHMSPGSWVRYGSQALRAPFGRIHWAGTETAQDWNGYMDGAVESGWRAAAEVLAAAA